MPIFKLSLKDCICVRALHACLDANRLGTCIEMQKFIKVRHSNALEKMVTWKNKWVFTESHLA